MAAIALEFKHARGVATALFKVSHCLALPDDSSCTVKLTHLCDWLDELCEHGPKYGYYPECIIIVDGNHEAEARSAFEHLGVKVVKGYRFLGGFIGDHDSTKAIIIQKKIVELMNSVVKLSKVAESQPQAAFSALAKTLQFELTMGIQDFKMQ